MESSKKMLITPTHVKTDEGTWIEHTGYKFRILPMNGRYFIMGNFPGKEGFIHRIGDFRTNEEAQAELDRAMIEMHQDSSYLRVTTSHTPNWRFCDNGNIVNEDRIII